MRNATTTAACGILTIKVRQKREPATYWLVALAIRIWRVLAIDAPTHLRLAVFQSRLPTYPKYH